MLAYAYQTLSEAGFRKVEAEDFQNIHDLMAAILIRGVSNQIKRGLHKDYINQSEILGNLRGKIDMTSSIKQQTMMTRRMVCNYDLFTEDTLLNQILKTTLLLLLRHGEVKLENRKALRKLLLYF
jgi:5-methylcytosine-specific restriction enzyme subunit McrC